MNPVSSFRSRASSLLHRSGNLLQRLGAAISSPAAVSASKVARQQTIDRWFADRGDSTLRLEYDLNETSTVFDMGGYEGQWTSDIFSKYLPTICVFEPVEAFALQIRQRFARNQKIQVYDFGLGNVTTTTRISLSANSSSIIKESESGETIRLTQAFDFVRQHGIGTIDLMKINIEGAEYDLLDHLIDSALIRQISNIQVQFHDFVPDAPRRMLAIQTALQKTHELTWQYPFVWENWRVNR